MDLYRVSNSMSNDIKNKEPFISQGNYFQTCIHYALTIERTNSYSVNVSLHDH